MLLGLPKIRQMEKVRNSRLSKTYKQPPKWSIEELRSWFNSDERKYTDDEIIIIRDFLDILIELNYMTYLKDKLNGTLISKTIINNEQKSYPLCTSEYGRTG